MELNSDYTRRDLIPSPFSARSRVHEYGGTPYMVTGDELVFVNDSDQHLYRVNLTSPEPDITQITKNQSEAHYRFADFCPTPSSDYLICVAETHHQSNSIINLIISVCLLTGEINPLCNGEDFYAYPRLSPNGKQLCWLSWNHPHMPWDENQLWLADVNQAMGSAPQLQNPKMIVGNPDEALFQPQWDHQGQLLVVSDRQNWWNLYHYNSKTNDLDPIFTIAADCATPLWSLGMSCYGLDTNNRLFVAYSQQGTWHLGCFENNQFNKLDLPFTDISSLSGNAINDQITFIAATAETSTAVYRLTSCNPLQAERLSLNPNLTLPNGYVSKPEAFEFITTDNGPGYGFYYPPSNPEYCAIKDELPPLIITCHGGPTGATNTGYNPKIQFWTSRGFAVADINYRGSTGYGRCYREKLTGKWGQADVEDAISAVNHLVSNGKGDPEKTIIRGSSAGGFTVLAALTFHDIFKAGACLYGIGDLEILARDTHKFESHYLEKLVAPYPQQADKYHALSPCYHADKLNCPIIFFQGLKDKVVPPEQAEKMVKILESKNQKVRYITFTNEGHGFRHSANIETALKEELRFYDEVFNLSRHTEHTNQNIAGQSPGHSGTLER